MPPTVISPLPAFSINAIFEARMFAFEVNAPALFELETITLSPEIFPETRLMFPLLFVIIMSPCAVTLESDVIPFLPEF